MIIKFSSYFEKHKDDERLSFNAAPDLDGCMENQMKTGSEDYSYADRMFDTLPDAFFMDYENADFDTDI